MNAKNTPGFVCLIVGLFTLQSSAASGVFQQEQVELSLRVTKIGHRQVRHLQVLVKNTSLEDIEIKSKEDAPPFYVEKWFLWTVDGKKARYSVNVAMIPDAVATWRIPPGGVVLWAEIPLRHLAVRTKSGYDSAIKDDRHHIITISASDSWKDITVKSGTLEIGEEDTEPKDALVAVFNGEWKSPNGKIHLNITHTQGEAPVVQRVNDKNFHPYNTKRKGNVLEWEDYYIRKGFWRFAPDMVRVGHTFPHMWVKTTMRIDPSDSTRAYLLIHDPNPNLRGVSLKGIGVVLKRIDGKQGAEPTDAREKK